MTSELPVVVFSDVDGVLCDPHTHAFADAARALSSIDDMPVSLVLCSNKTRAEIESIQQALGLHHPFVCESGGAAFVPAGYFGFDVPHARDIAGYQAVEFGRPHAEIAQALRRTATRLRVDIVAFSDMSVDEVARETGLSLLQARLAKLPSTASASACATAARLRASA
jgi:predicted mannosyl-3-phosphoglycerate phosphatase (HAD superfamily)